VVAHFNLVMTDKEAESHFETPRYHPPSMTRRARGAGWIAGMISRGRTAVDVEPVQLIVLGFPGERAAERYSKQAGG
jgi:hypothetical protein